MYTLEDRNRVPLKQYNLTVTGTNWTTSRAVGVPYQTINGVWRLRGNVSGSISVASATLTLSIDGILWGSTSDEWAGAWATNGTTETQLATLNTGTNQVGIVLDATGTVFRIFFDGEVSTMLLV